MKKIYLLLIAFISLTIMNENAQADKNKGILFKFNQKVGDTFKITGKTRVKFYRQNVLRINSSSNWHSIQKAKQNTKRGIKYSFFYQSRNRKGELNTGKSVFIRNKNGRMYTYPSSFYPKSKSIPHFPDKRVKKKQMWKKPGLEIVDFRKIGLSKPFKLKFTARYRYLKDTVINGRKHAVIQCFYVVSRRLRTKIHVPGYSRYRPRRLVPARFIGYYERIFYWDFQKGYWTKMTAKINLILTFTNAMSVEWKSNVDSYMKKN